ncbi:hypothetical protein AB1N83_013381 [Pleurotus pulmonarius]
MARSKHKALQSPRPATFLAVDKNVSGSAAEIWEWGRNEVNMRSTKRLFATERSNEATLSPQETSAASPAEECVGGSGEISRQEAEELSESVGISPAFRSAEPAMEKQGQGAKRMRKRRKVGGYNGTHAASSPAAKAAFHETSSPTKQVRGTPTPTTIASELAVESRPTVQTYTKMAFDIYACSHCGQRIIGRNRSSHSWHCGRAKAGARCDLCGHVSYKGRKGSIERHQKSASCREKRMDYARSLAQLRSAVPRRMRVQVAIEHERENRSASAAYMACAAAARDDDGVSGLGNEKRDPGAYHEDLKDDGGEGGSHEEGDGHDSATTDGEQERVVSASSDAAEDTQGLQEEED